MDWTIATTYVLYVISMLVVLAFVAFVIFYLTAAPYPSLIRAESERFFRDSETNKLIEFPSIEDKPDCILTVVIPAFNEALRLPVMLEDCLSYLEKRLKCDSKFSYEIIVVDDGSSDSTSDIALGYCARYKTDKIRVITGAKNRGKGGAVRLGVLSSRGRYILFADADGATRFSDVEKLEAKAKHIEQEQGLALCPLIVCGSRAHLEDEVKAKRSIPRTLLMYGWHMLVWLFCVRTVRDTQCGFKLFSRESARLCFLNMHVERWAFDVDLLYIAEFLRVPIAEVAVNWKEIDGSKMIPLFSWLQMGKDLVFVWLRYFSGAWKIQRRPTLHYQQN